MLECSKHQSDDLRARIGSGRCLPGRLPAWLALAGLILASALQAQAAKVDVVDGVPHVRNGAKPESGHQTMKLEELWRVGGDDEDTMFGVILSVLAGDNGELYFLDMQLSEVQVYSPDGEHLRTLSRMGDGPGESRNPSDMLFLPDGNLGLVQAFPGKVTRIDPEGNPAGTLTLGGQDPTKGGFTMIFDARCRGESIVFAGMEIAQQGQTGQKRTSFLASFSQEGTEQVRYLEKTAELDFTRFEIIERDNHFVYPRRWDIGSDGRIYAAPHRNRYSINVYAPDGRLERVIEREYASRTRTPEEQRRIEDIVAAQTRQVPFEFKTELENTEPDVSNVRVADDGSIWVLSSSGAFEQPKGIMATYDVFDADGTFRRQVSVECEGKGAGDGLFFMGGERVILVKGLIDAVLGMQAGGMGAGSGDDGEAEPMSVVCYRIDGVR